MRFVLVITAAVLTSFSTAFAADPGKILNTEEMTALAAKAAQATPKEQCYLYAQLVSAMTEIASQQVSAGDTTDASASLKSIQEYTEKIHTGISDNSKKLKDAQIMMRRTAFRLKELMRDASLENQAAFESTLKQLDQVQSQMMLAVFKK